jgi:hypothetical protein
MHLVSLFLIIGAFCVYTKNGDLVGCTKIISLVDGWNKEKFVEPITLQKDETYFFGCVMSTTVNISHNNTSHGCYYFNTTNWTTNGLPTKASFSSASYYQFSCYVKHEDSIEPTQFGFDKVVSSLSYSGNYILGMPFRSYKSEKFTHFYMNFQNPTATGI